MTDRERAPPERLGPYRIERPLGRGGMGEVFLARDERLGRAVAIKRIRLDAPVHAELRERLRREARAAASLNHPAIVQVYDVLTAEGRDWIVLEYVAGESLAELMIRGGLDAATALDLGRQIAEGLAHAHARGIIHRDLKAENVRVAPDVRAKILDLGLAKPVAGLAERREEEDSLTTQGAIVGTPRAMAPEQAAGGPVDARADLFSLGVLLHELLTGRSPFRGSSPAMTLRNVLAGRAPRLWEVRPELPAELDELVASLLAPDPSDRPAGAAEVARRLGELAARPMVASLGPPVPRAEASGLSQAATGSRASGGPWPAGPDVPRLERVEARPAYREAIAGRRGWWIGAAGVLAAAALVTVGLIYGRAPSVPRVVAVLAPDVTSAGEGFELAASGVAGAVVETLASLGGIDAVDPGEVLGSSASPAEVALAVAADETVGAALACREEWCQVSLRRIGAGGRVLAAAPPFEVSARPEDVLELAGAVRAHLGRLYPGHSPRAGAPPLDVRPQDYASYLGLRRREAAGERLGTADLARLDVILEGSPAFLEGRLLAANLARVLREPERARRHAERAARLDPRDLRALAVLARLELDAGSLEDAEAAVARLEAAAPGSSAARVARARLLARLDRRPEAVEAWREVVARRPSWTHLYWLAREEVAAGLPDDARAHLEELLDRSPGNEFGLTLLAGLEARSGDLQRAEALYRELISRDTQPLYHTNLGWVRFLLGRYEEAIGSYRQALVLAPGDLHTRFNLAVAEAAAGRTERAREGFRELLGELEAAGSPSPSANDLLIRAQCLARLGRSGEAVALTDRTLKDHPEEPQLRYQAALVYALVGESYSALHNARAAVEGGLSGAWFAIPAFDRLRADPEVQALLAGKSDGAGR